MLTFHNPHHARHAGQQEMFRGQMVPCHEVPARLDHVLAELQRRPVGPLRTPDLDSPAAQAALDTALVRVHSPRYLDFLASAWDEWVAMNPANAALDALPSVWPLPNQHGFRTDVLPRNFAARLGVFSFDSGTPLTAGSWPAARAGAACALAATQAVLAGERSAFALTRPPGHHAGPDFMGGYCFINNAALAAQALRDGGHTRVAVLDVDYHHGNGTQEIFYTRDDVFFASIHADPSTDYPFFLGYADETGADAGDGFNLNLPLAQGASPEDWFAALDVAIARVASFRPDAVIVSLGVDTYEGDPISHFKLRTREDYPKLGERIAALTLPTLFILEGGYAVKEIGDNVAAVLRGFAR